MFNGRDSREESFFNAISKRQLEALLLRDGQEGLDFLESVFKWRAKTLKRALGATASHLKLMQVQEALSNALGFPSTHALQRVLSTLRRDFQAAGPETRGLVLKSREDQWGALVRLNHLANGFKNSNLPLEGETFNLLARVAQGMASTLAVPQPTLRDAIAKAWAEASNWDKLTARTPLSEPNDEPILMFSVEGTPSSRKSEGFFHMTQAGHWIWDNALGSDETSNSVPETLAQAKARIVEVKRLISRFPDLYVAYATLSAIYEEHYQELGEPWSIVRTYLAEGITRAEALWPKGFKGTLSWGHLDNRPYLRMLHQQLSLDLKTQWGWRFARRTASKLMRLNPDDGYMSNQGPLLIGLGAAASTKKRLHARALKQESPSGLLHAGFAQILEGENRVEGLALLLESILRVPEFGALMLGDSAVRPLRRYSRPVGYEDPADEASAVLYWLSEPSDIGRWLTKVLQDRELLGTEQRLGQLIEARRNPQLTYQQRGDVHQAWDTQIRDASRQLAQRLLERYPSMDAPSSEPLS